MGTSGSFGGSGGKDAKDLRDNIAAWLDGDGAGFAGADGDGATTADGNADATPTNPPGVHAPGGPTIDLGPAVRLLFRSRGGSGDGPGGGGGGGGGGSGGGRSSGGVTRSVGRISRAAGRAGSLALAYSSGNRAALQSAGLNYDELRALGDPVAIGIKIVEAAFEAQADSTLADAEERDIVAEVVAWILEHPADRAPSPEEVVRKTIETTIAEAALTEISSSLYEKGASFAERQSVEQQIRDVAAEYATQATLSATGATEQEMSTAIETGLKDIGTIFGVNS
ncbi:hypothetical protein [Microbacterium phyllosphaerae]|uniref:hypothetical protein n=1 Tax=Microbacterium phyllosphaerae TaxID=124798 RepID=UPI000EA4061D|nr:hypothetical protein [Microbacterium phyllosphaerae]